ncbi:MAG: hypothetical protein E6H66_11500 [Betaproteobacteria bacterium]|nr:MAG: hypothetical protein E6H66_11500 [Betaproteobacteria bacterium]
MHANDLGQRLGPRAPDARRIERAHIKLGLAISGLRGLRITIGHFPVGYGIGIGNGVRKENGTKKNRQKGSLHEILEDPGKITRPAVFR